MTWANAMQAILSKLGTAATDAGVTLFSSIRGAETATPCWIWDVAISRVPITPNGRWQWTAQGGQGKTSCYWQAELTITVVGDSLGMCFDSLDVLSIHLDAGPYVVQPFGTGESYKLTIESFGPFTTEAATPDDGQQDAERSISGSVSIHITEI